MYDAMPARDITPPEGGDVLSLLPGQECEVSFANKLYPARVVAIGKYASVVRDVSVNITTDCVGKYRDIKKKQQEREKEAERNDMGMEVLYPLFEGAVILIMICRNGNRDR